MSIARTQCRALPWLLVPEPTVSPADGMVLTGRRMRFSRLDAAPPRAPDPGRRLRIQAQVAEDFLDDRSLHDGRDDLQFPGAAVRALFDWPLSLRVHRNALDQAAQDRPLLNARCWPRSAQDFHFLRADPTAAVRREPALAFPPSNARV